MVDRKYTTVHPPIYFSDCQLQVRYAQPYLHFCPNLLPAPSLWQQCPNPWRKWPSCWRHIQWRSVSADGLSSKRLMHFLWQLWQNTFYSAGSIWSKEVHFLTVTLLSWSYTFVFGLLLVLLVLPFLNFQAQIGNIFLFLVGIFLFFYLQYFLFSCWNIFIFLIRMISFF